MDEYKAMEGPTYLDDFGEEDESNWDEKITQKDIKILITELMLELFGILIGFFLR